MCTYFERISIFVILVNCVTLGLYDPSDKDCKTQRCQILESMEKAIYAFFLAEMLCKWMAMGLFGKNAYFADSWNRLDCFIVAAGWELDASILTHLIKGRAFNNSLLFSFLGRSNYCITKENILALSVPSECLGLFALLTEFRVSEHIFT